jgi:23S rRNA pseudouridine2605 synthase
MRLQKYLAHAGIASRRASEELVAAGSVTVNGVVVRDPARDVSEADDVRYEGKPVHPVAQPVHILLHKPVGVMSTVHDPQGRTCVLDLIETEGRRLYPVGRLDFDTSGLLLLTDDGAFAHRMTHPSSEVVKTYEARVQGIPDAEALKCLREGILIDGRPTAPAGVTVLMAGETNAVLEFRIHEGRNRQVRRMLEAVGLPAMSLCRTGYGPLRLGDLAPGRSRLLAPREVEALLAISHSTTQNDAGRV